MKNIFINSQSEMTEFAKEIANSIENNKVIALYGNLGVGKSFFAIINSCYDRAIENTKDLTSTYFLFVK